MKRLSIEEIRDRYNYPSALRYAKEIEEGTCDCCCSENIERIGLAGVNVCENCLDYFFKDERREVCKKRKTSKEVLMKRGKNKPKVEREIARVVIYDIPTMSPEGLEDVERWLHRIGKEVVMKPMSYGRKFTARYMGRENNE